MGTIVTMVLAARPGDGFERTRWLEPWGRGTLLGHVLDEVRTWPVTPGVVVLGRDAEPVIDRIDFSGFSVLIDPEWREGAAALRAGLDYLMRQPDIEAVVLADGDTPQVTEKVVSQLMDAHRESKRPVTVPKYRYTRGRPLVIDRELWPRLIGLEENSEVEAVLDTHADLVEEVWVDALPPRHVLTPDDLKQLAPRH